MAGYAKGRMGAPKKWPPCFRRLVCLCRSCSLGENIEVLIIDVSLIALSSGNFFENVCLFKLRDER